jgi:hypothetical protein
VAVKGTRSERVVVWYSDTGVSFFRNVTIFDGNCHGKIVPNL